MIVNGRTFFLAVLFGSIHAITHFVVVEGQVASDSPAPSDPLRPHGQLKLAKFDIDATPPVGFSMAYDRVRRVEELGLRCRGVVLIGSGQPIVLCAIDWIGIGNGAHDAFRQRLAVAAATVPSRVAVHTLHQHDAPRCDFTAEQLLHQAGAVELGPYDGSFARTLLNRIDVSVTEAMAVASRVTHLGVSTVRLDGLASNRRILGDDGKVRYTRYTTTRDPKIRAFPDGTIDPDLTAISFWNKEQPLAVLSYYACHPQSYYRTGIPSPDFPGIARFMRGQDLPDVLHVHFNGAGGNIGAGKYNDGAKANRMVLANRMASGMKKAFESTERLPISADAIDWSVVKVALPIAKHLDRESLQSQLSQWSPKDYWGSADQLAWVMRCERGDGIDVSCLKLGGTRVLHMPGELFVEYQLAAKAMRTDLNIAMAAYGDYGPGYIGTEIAYEQGGYETSPAASKVAPETERVLMNAMKELLEVNP
ncbi:MAG: hypothetical protein AAF989_03580 [Planctomycetota bacterium]